jgi:GNAT superfamily N-acetyltransferase
MNSLDVRLARPTDRDAVLVLLQAQLDEHGIATPPAAIAGALDGLLEDADRGAVLVAMEDGRVVGFAALSAMWTLEHGGPAVWLDELYVEPSRRGSGIGRALLAAAGDVARGRGARTLDLEVDVTHARAERLYAREGFRRLERTRWVRRLDHDPAAGKVTHAATDTAPRRGTPGSAGAGPRRSSRRDP